jgi:peptidoglycan/LPS O-acetylase OafA/YrhL
VAKLGHPRNHAPRLSADPPNLIVTDSKMGFQMPSLDGLRALSIGLVFFAHSGMSAFPGGFGVTIFFFLSGFLITTLLRREYERNGSISFRKFYLRRVLRILPPFYLVLGGALIATYLLDLPGTIDFSAVRAQALQYTNYWIITHSFDGLPSGTGVFWSLAVEEHFYLLFPLLFVGLTRSGARPEGQALVLLLTCAALLVWRVVLSSRLDFLDVMAPQRLEIASDTRFDSILFGCILALYGNPALDPSRFGERLWKYVFFPLSVCGLLFSFLYRDEYFRDTFRYTLQGICLISVFVCAVRYPNWVPMRPLNFRPIAFLGVLSYSLYLVHQVVIAAVEHELADFGGTTRAICALAISLAIAWLLYIAVEKPCARLRRRLRA